MINIYTRGAAFHVAVDHTREEVAERLEKARFNSEEFVEFTDFRGVTVEVRERSVDIFWEVEEGSTTNEAAVEADTE